MHTLLPFGWATTFAKKSCSGFYFVAVTDILSRHGGEGICHSSSLNTPRYKE